MSKDLLYIAFNDLYNSLIDNDLIICTCDKTINIKCPFCVAKDIFSGVENKKYYSGNGKWKRPAIKCVNTGEIFKNANQAGLKYNINPANIIKSCKGQSRSAGKLNGYKMVWVFADPRNLTKIL